MIRQALLLSAFVLGVAACPNPSPKGTLWLAFEGTGIVLTDHEPPPY